MASTTSTTSLTSSSSAPSPFPYALLPAANAVHPEPALSRLESRARFSQVCSHRPQPPYPVRFPKTRPWRARRQAVISDRPTRPNPSSALTHPSDAGSIQRLSVYFQASFSSFSRVLVARFRVHNDPLRAQPRRCISRSQRAGLAPKPLSSHVFWLL